MLADPKNGECLSSDPRDLEANAINLGLMLHGKLDEALDAIVPVATAQKTDPLEARRRAKPRISRSVDHPMIALPG